MGLFFAPVLDSFLPPYTPWRSRLSFGRLVGTPMGGEMGRHVKDWHGGLDSRARSFSAIRTRLPLKVFVLARCRRLRWLG